MKGKNKKRIKFCDNTQKMLLKENGVTIMTLVIAIIILIILARISMSAIVGNNGILDTATEAKISAEVSTYQGELDVIEVQNKTEQINVGMDAAEYINEFKEKVEKSTVFEGSAVNKMTSKILRIQTPEGYVFIVTEDGIEYAGINGQFEEKYELSEEDFTFTYDPTYWTNQNVHVTIELNFDTESTIQYSLDEEEWIDYEEDGIIIETNCIIYVRLVYVDPYGDNYITGEVTNIDKTLPVIDNLTSTTNSVTILVSDSSDGVDGVSGIVGYYISTSSNIPSEEDFIDCRDEDGNGVTSLEVTVDGLKQETTYYVWVIDDAGNINEQNDKSTVTTDKVPDGDDEVDDGTGNLTAVITFEYSTTEWTNENVTATVVVNGEAKEKVEEGTYIVQYNVDDPDDEDDWQIYTEAVEFETNGSIYARLSAGTNVGDYVTGTVTNIDKIDPTVTIDSAEIGVTTDITVTGSASDDLSGIKEIYVGVLAENGEYYSEDDIDWITVTVDEDWTFEYTYEKEYEGILAEETYIMGAKAVDNAGNESEIAESDEVETEGDYVDYSSVYEVIEDGDTTNDWRLFYVVEENDEDRDISRSYCRL